MSDQELLAGYADVWWQAIDDFTGLLETLEPEDWDRPTDLPGWDVRAVAAHFRRRAFDPQKFGRKRERLAVLEVDLKDFFLAL